MRLVDANTFGDLENALRLGQAIIECGLKKAIVADVRAETVTRHPELFKSWKQAGLAAAVIGFEEISDARILEELFHSGRLQPGQNLLCFIPESGRFSHGFVWLIVEA